MNTLETDFSEKVVLITGGTKGLGKECVIELAKLGARIVYTGRSNIAGKLLGADIRLAYKNAKTHFIYCDHCSITSIQKMADIFKKTYDRLDIQIHNVGGFTENFDNEQGYNGSIMLNFYSHFYLSDLLYPVISKTKESRIIMVSCPFHKDVKEIKLEDIEYENRKFSSLLAYSEAKLYDVLMTRGLEYIIGMNEDTENVKAVCINPGFAATELYKKINELSSFIYWKTCFCGMSSPATAVKTYLHCALCPWDDLQSGSYYENCKQNNEAMSKLAQDDDLMQDLWDMTVESQIKNKIELNSFKKTFHLIPVKKTLHMKTIVGGDGKVYYYDSKEPPPDVQLEENWEESPEEPQVRGDTPTSTPEKEGKKSRRPSQNMETISVTPPPNLERNMVEEEEKTPKPSLNQVLPTSP